jgi:ABC-type branched-subunit amino acid transport system ATPase component
LATLGASRLRRTGVGRSLVAMRDNEQCAASFGLSPTVSKLSGFAFAGALAALAGGLYAGLNVYFSIDTINGITPFGPEQSLQVIAMAVIGGLGSVSGTLVGAIYVVGLPALFNHDAAVGLGTSGIGLLILLLFAPGGLAGIAYRARDAALNRALRHLPETSAWARPLEATSDERSPQPIIREPDSHAGSKSTSYALVAEGIGVRFGGLAAVVDVSVDARVGEVVGLIGSNGAGKSTLMNVISGFQPASGSIQLWDQDATALAPYERARLGVGRVFQDARLFGDLTVFETVQVALEVHERSEFVPSLLGYPPARRAERHRRAQAATLIDFLGLGRYSNSFVSDLSTGTRRIVELCCLVARGSKLLLLDEPTAGVAQRETEAFGPLIQSVRSELDATVVIIEHDMPLVMSISDRVYCLDAGRVIADGAPEAVRHNPAVIAAYLGTDERAIARSGVVKRNRKMTKSSKSAARNGAVPGDDETVTARTTKE